MLVQRCAPHALSSTRVGEQAVLIGRVPQAAAEKIVLAANGQDGLKTCSLRIGGIIGQVPSPALGRHAPQ